MGNCVTHEFDIRKDGREGRRDLGVVMKNIRIRRRIAEEEGAAAEIRPLNIAARSAGN